MILVPHCAIFFDLDDTLYLERDYVRSGFMAVSEHIGERIPDIIPESIFDHLWRSFEAGVRGDAFNRLLEAFPIISETIEVDDLVDTYRHHPPLITLQEDMAVLLEELKERDMVTGLITDGMLATQRLKISALKIHDLLDHIIITGQLGREYWKPHDRPFETAEQLTGLPPGSHTYVADNPAKDFGTPARRGWTTVRLRFKGQLHQQAATVAPGVDREVSSTRELRQYLLRGCT